MNDINRTFFSPEQKVAILREHLVEGKAVSDLCEKHRIHPTVLCQWQRQFFENGTAAFESKQSRSRVSDGYQKKIETRRPGNSRSVDSFISSQAASSSSGVLKPWMGPGWFRSSRSTRPSFPSAVRRLLSS